MLKRKNLQVFFDGSLNIKTFSIISLKRKKFIFYDQLAILMLKNHKLQVTDVVKNSIYRKKYF
jgi:hypothetical protein